MKKLTTVGKGLTYEQVTQLITRLDDKEDIMIPRLGRWRVWPIVRPRVRVHFIETYFRKPSSPASLATPSQTRLRLRVRQLFLLLIAMGHGLINFPFRRKGALLIIRLCRNSPELEGRRLDYFFGDLLDGYGLREKPIVLENNSGEEKALLLPHRNRLSQEPYIGIVGFLSRFHLRDPDVIQAARHMSRLISSTTNLLSEQTLYNIFLESLARFEAGRKVYGWLFRRLSSSALLVIDADAKCAEIAAAKEAGMQVVEIQHGMFGPQDPEFSWPNTYLPFREEMVIPDMAFVFGKLWQDIALQRGFWNDAQIIRGGSMMMDQIRNKHEHRPKTAQEEGPIRILFATQWVVKNESIKFWETFLSTPVFPDDTQFELMIKIHPGEVGNQEEYRALAARFEDRCSIIQPDASILELILEANVVVSYYSTTLIEAVGLGVPAVSLRSHAAPGGFSEIFKIPWLDNIMSIIGHPEELASLLRERALGTDGYRDWQAQTKKFGEEMFERGFLDIVSSQLTKLIEDTSASR